MKQREAIKTNALVLSRRNYLDADRFITLFTYRLGKVSALAKGVRKLSSRKRSALEPGCHSEVLLIKSKGRFILAEAKPLANNRPDNVDLNYMTKLNQVLEILDGMTAEEEAHPQIYTRAIHLIGQLNETGNHYQQIVDTTKIMLKELGFGVPESSSNLDLKNHIEQILGRPLRSKAFHFNRV